MNTSQRILVALCIAAACVAGWIWHGSTSAGGTSSDPAGDTARVQPDRAGMPMQSDVARSASDGGVPMDREDPEWSRLGRTNVVLPAISTIPRLFGASDTYRDQALNPRDTYIPPPHQERLSAIVDSFMSRIREADRQAIVAHGEAAKERTAVEAAEPTKNNVAQANRSSTRQQELMDAIASAQASGRSAKELIAQEVRSPEPAKPSSTISGNGGQPPITPQPMSDEPLRLRMLSISLREELLGRMTKLLLGIGVLKQLEVDAITISVKRRLHTPQPLQPK